MDTVALRTEIQKMMKVYGIKNGSFCCTDLNDEFHGFMTIQENPNAAGLFESAMNIGRLWQHTRSIIRDVLDDFEKAMK